MSNRKSVDLSYERKCEVITNTLPDYVKTYMRAIKQATSPRTRYEYAKDIQNFLRYISPDKQPGIKILDTLSRDDFEAYFEYLERYEKDGREYENSRVSIKRKLAALRKFFGYLFESSLIDSDETRKLLMPKVPKKEIIRLDVDETKAFLNEINHGSKLTAKQKDYHDLQSDRDLAIAYLLLSTGMRVSECAELDLDDIDLKSCSVRITRKGGNESIVYFSDEALPYIQNYIETRKADKSVPDTEKALFLSSRKTRLAVRSIEVIIKKYAQRAVPLKNITPHKLRATYATRLYEATDDIYLVAESLGHSDVDTTKNHYAGMTDSHKKNSRNKVSLNA